VVFFKHDEIPGVLELTRMNRPTVRWSSRVVGRENSRLYF
jgi:hypothetical protein